MINQPYPGYTAPHGSEDYGPDPRWDDEPDPLEVDTHDYTQDADWCDHCQSNKGDDSIIEVANNKTIKLCTECWLDWLLSSNYSEIEKITRIMFVFGEDYDDAHRRYINISFDRLVRTTYERVNGRALPMAK